MGGLHGSQDAEGLIATAVFKGHDLSVLDAKTMVIQGKFLKGFFIGVEDQVIGPIADGVNGHLKMVPEGVFGHFKAAFIAGRKKPDAVGTVGIRLEQTGASGAQSAVDQ